ncbi:MAG: hypothetical protein STSR0007_00330 [Thermovirga sp.]
MVRTVKTHDERKQELMAIAGDLFLDQGFENTAVSDIVARAEVAQGTFYYYFDSKEAVLEAILAGYIDALYKRIQIRCETSPADAKTRLRVMLESFIEFTGSDEARIFRLLRDKEQIVIGDRVRKYWNGKLFPLLNAIIDQGIREKTMQAGHRDETLIFFWKIFHVYCEGISQGEEPGILDIKRHLFEKLTNVLLGMENWTLRPTPAGTGLDRKVEE